jgi:ABC-2 type transport system ATP-binding protein
MIKILTGYLQPDSGRVTVDGVDVLSNPLQVQKRIGYLPENAPLYPEMSVQAYLKMIAELRLIPADDQPVRLSEAVRATALEDHLARPIGQLSKGYRQRVGLAQAILHKPKLLILDEPTVGLDPTQIIEVRGLIRRLARRSTVLLSTHILSEVEATCDRVIILLNGQVKADARLAELSATTDVVLVLASRVESAQPSSSQAHGGEMDMPGTIDDLKALPGVRAVQVARRPGGHEYRIRGSDGVDLRPAVYGLARDRDWPLRELRRDARTLETVFNELATAAGSGQAPPANLDCRPGEEKGERWS